MDSSNNRKAALKKLRSLIISPKGEVEKFRKKIEDTFSTVVLPNNVECSRRDYGGVMCDMLIPEMYTSGKVMIYIHGGSFTGGSSAAYRSFAASLANAANCRVLVPDFRLPPSYSFPSGIEDLQSVFRSFFIQEEIECSLKNKKSDLNLTVAADSSGASIACGLLQELPEKSFSRISMLLLFSPWLDFSPDSYIFGRHAKDEVLTGESVKRAVEFYTYESNYTNPEVSPLKIDRDKLSKFPPVYIQCGSRELFIEQVKTFDDMLERSGVECTLDIVDDMMFMFQLADEYIREAHLAVNRVGAYLTKKTESESEIRERELLLKRNNVTE
ncbi:alpha/beta hydrolase fold domain-containing protein [Treponema sp.]|uniref:alpha/beta hydrolase fold domain-containing protein n=1 Tax=Treponema sp. TaxID=166 RepID=UPI0025FC6444|nr:alpha/beta hydrolase fold domain-containing protein [Treponema sp.]MCR5217369.1 alpha/beta hydrolase [Treponema sp.]